MNLQRRIRRKPTARTRSRFLARLIHGLPIVPFVFCLVHVLVPGTAAGQEDSVDEYKLKAAMLYNLSHFVEWPDSAYPDRQAPITLCILGQDPFASSLASTIPKETDKGRPMVVRHLQSDMETQGCHILYISSSERKTTAHIFSTLNGSCILTVGEMTQFAAHGGIIQFSLEDQHVRFDININAASRAGLKISSKLLALAQIVNN
jgi:YfiR/HmsC-like